MSTKKKSSPRPPKKTKVAPPKLRLSPESKDLPATQGMLYHLRSELKADNRELRAEMKAEFKKVDARFSKVDGRFNSMEARFNSVDARFNEIDARFSQVDARFNQVDAKLEQVHSEISRLALIVEEQNSRNQVVLEGITALWQRQERVEVRMDGFENWMRSVSRTQGGS